MTLNDAQREAVLHDRGPLLVLAGAGSGKTKVVTTRIARLLSQGTLPTAVLAVTFTNKAAKEMKARLTEIAGPYARGVWVSTFHSLCVRLLRKDADRIGLSKVFTIVDEGDQMAQLQRVAREFGVKLEEKEPRMVLSRIGLWKNQGVRIDGPAPSTGDPISLLAAQLWRPYARHLRALAALDFDDLLVCARELLEKAPDVREKYREQFKYIHIDEYQDTNPLQLDITRLLVGDERNICVVGDDDQAIYAFRGADLENILAFDKHFEGCKVVKLEENYRSTGLILGAANAVIAQNKTRRKKTLRSTLGDGRPVEIFAAEDGEGEAESVGARIFDLVMRRKMPGDKVALLYRAAPQSRAFEDSLRIRGVPYRVVGGMEFYKRKEVKDTLAYLACIARPDDEIAFRRVVNLPTRGLGDKSVDKIIACARALTPPKNAIDYAAEGAPGAGLKPAQLEELTAFARPLVDVRHRTKAPNVADLVRRAVDDAGLAALVEEESEIVARQKIADSIDEVVDAFAAFVDRIKRGDEPELVDREPVDAFLDRVTLDDEEEREDERDEERKKRGKVQLMSLHASKGLEFPVVFLVGMEDGLLPHRRALEESERGIEEERRLCYVGMTRAQRTLVCTWAKSRRKRHEIVARRRSRFLDDVPAECLVPDKPVEEPPADPAAAFFSTMREKLGQ